MKPSQKITIQEYKLLNKIAKPSKYRNVKTEVNGVLFDSKKEATRYKQLLAMIHANIISHLQIQVPFKIAMDGKLICTYKADFVYMSNGNRIVEDCKGVKTPVYNLKKKLMKAFHGVEIKEV